MLISQAGDSLRDVREDRPASRMTGRCQMPSGNEIAGQVIYVPRATIGRTISGQVRPSRQGMCACCSLRSKPR